MRKNLARAKFRTTKLRPEDENPNAITCRLQLDSGEIERTWGLAPRGGPFPAPRAPEQARVHRQVPAHLVKPYEHKAWNMITIGGDSHKRTRTVVAVDQVGRKAVHSYVKG